MTYLELCMLKHFSILFLLLSFISPIAQAKELIADTDIEALVFISHAIADDDIELLKRILSHNVNLKAKDEGGWTSTMHAVRHNRPEMLTLLINKGASINAKDDDEGMTALMMAAYDGKLELVQILLNYGANVHLEDNYDMTALELAQEQAHVEIAELLLKHGAK